MIIIMVRERNRVLVIETEAQTIHRVQHNGNIVQHHITILSTYGETALSWEEEDFANYHSLRLHIDSMLQAMHKGYEEFVSQSQIDSLRYLLSSKEEHLYQIMQLFHSQNSQEGMQFSHLPAEAQPRTVIRKKKGFTGFLGAKETLEIVPSASTILKTLNKELLSMQEERQESINAYTDSLRNHNKELNRKLRHLITTMNNQTERVLEAKEVILENLTTVPYVSSPADYLRHYSACHILSDIQKDLREKARTRKRLEDTIQQNTALLEMRKNIILTISHDIRAPLNVIDGSADLAMDTREKKRRNIHLNNIRRVCKHVVHLLNNLLDVYRLNEAKEIRNDVPFDLHELLERTAAGFSHIINNKGILFNCDFKDTEVKLYGDADRIEQIIDNLLTNAVKFTETGTINFNVHYLNGLLVMEIVDTGVGMSEETLSRIFRPFERQTSATNADGFGLGLPITQGLVNLLDGTIEVTSLINCGSTFRVTLPMPETDEPLESEKHVPTHSTHLHHNVLVIDDDSMLQAVIKEMLERNGMACTTCTTVKEVVKAMREKDYDLLLTDILMPYTNGVELLTLLRNSSIGNSKTIPLSL